MISPDISKEDYSVYRMEESGLPSNTYLLSSDASRSILYNPHVAGVELQTRMEKVSPLFIDAATEKALKGTRIDNMVEFVLLAGGLYYFMARGFRERHGLALPQCFLGIKRQRVEGTEGKFKAVSTYENFESLPRNASVIIGDTIATGATMVRALGELERASSEIRGKIDKLVICSLACSSDGAKLLKSLEDRMKRANPDFRMYLFAAEQLFHLMPDGTDMRFLGEKSMVPEQSREHTLERYGPALGKKMKCAVFDWGTRCKNPKKHYNEFLEFAEEILDGPELDEKGKSEIRRMQKEINEKLQSLEKTL
ncbi:hypothetical protein GF318_02500 [Candidatus Micrarchaeota archaeon]|nr:hypothetical protein [Candidatus Micrarchaeota archaeon]